MTWSGGRHAVVTGAASGIGRAAAEALRHIGDTVTAIDRDDPGDATDPWHGVDLGLDAEPLRDVDAAVDVLVNTAGLPPREGQAADILTVNFLALRRLATGLMPRVANGGAIANVASRAGANRHRNIAQVRRLLAQRDDARPDPFVAEESIDPVRAFILSKGAVIAWTKAMTAPLIDKRQRMNCVSPAAADTPIPGTSEAAFGDRATRGIALTRRAGRSEEVAAVIAFLLLPGSAWVRGCNIEADGGLTAQLEAEALSGVATDAEPTGAAG